MSEIDPAEQLDQLSEEFVAGLRAGRKPSISAYAARHPELADQIRKLFPTLQQMEGFKADLVVADDPMGTELGEYRLIREVGRGGMGVVYEAVQETLDRRVALKMLPANLTRDPRFLERFRLEARLAGRLQHPNIVPVIGIGEHDGVHYFAMQYIEGRGLDALFDDVNERRRAGADGSEPEPDPLVDRLLASALSGSSSTSTSVSGVASAALPARAPTTVGRAWFDNAARLLLQASDGVAAAHARAILHRDIKPGNLLVDEQGKVWITDFGLCKEEGSSNLTQPGDVLGTLRYMPPERLKGESDVQGDVYGLGISLWELVTLQPAYPEDDHAQLLARLSTEDLPRPRSVNPDIPRDLEAVVLKATARDRKQRYATAEALASDLRAFIERRPIAARPPSFAYHLRSAIRRHRALTATLLLAFIALLASTAYYVTNLQQKEADTRFQSYVANIAAANAALQARDLAAARRHLEAAPTEFRGWEWRHIDSRFDRSLRTTRVAEGRIQSVAYSPDGHAFAVAGRSAIRIFDDASAAETHRLDVQGTPSFVAWSPRADSLAAVTQAGIEVWSWPGRRRTQILRPVSRGSRMAWSGDGRRIAAGGDDGVLRVFELGVPKPIAAIPVRSLIKSVAMHSSEPWVAVGTWDGQATLWDIEAGTRLWSRRVSSRGLHGIAFVGEAYVATPTERPQTHVWHVRDGSLQRTLARPRQPGTNRVAASPDGRVLVVGTQSSLAAYDTATWEPLVEWRDAGEVRGLAVHPSGSRVATVGLGGEVWEWGVALDGDPHLLQGHMDDLFDVAYAPSGAYLVSVGIGAVRCWDATTGEQRRVWIGSRWTPMRVAVSADSRLVAVGDRSGDVVLWDVATDAIRSRLMGHGDYLGGAAFAPDGLRLYVVGEGASEGVQGTLHVWDLARAERVAQVDLGSARGTALAVHPSGRWIATGDAQGVIQIWDATTLQATQSIPAHEQAVEKLAFDALSTRLFSCSSDGALKVWDRTDGSHRRTMQSGPIYSMALCPDGTRIAAGGRDGTIRMWDPETGQLVFTRSGLEAWINALQFSPDGTRLAAAENAARVRVFDTRPLRERRSGAHAASALRRRASALIDGLARTEPNAERVIAAVRSHAELEPPLKEAALREAHRRHGSDAGLIAFLWRAITSRKLGLIDRLVALSLAQDMHRAAGHNNRQDRRRDTLLGAMNVRAGRLETAVWHSRAALHFNLDREPYLVAVDLAFLTMGHAGMGQAEQARGALARLEAHLAANTELIDARLEQFRAEARKVVAALPK